MGKQLKTNDVRIEGELGFVDVGTKKYPHVTAVVDAVDVPKLLDGRGRWNVIFSHAKQFRVCRRTSAGMQYMSRHLCDETDPRIFVDHADGDTLNHRRKNLRPCTPFQNQGNRAKNRNSKSPFKGASQAQDGRWDAQIHVRGKHLHLGRFDTAKEAADAYDAAARRTFGAFARPNSGVAT